MNISEVDHMVYNMAGMVDFQRAVSVITLICTFSEVREVHYVKCSICFLQTANQITGFRKSRVQFYVPSSKFCQMSEFFFRMVFLEAFFKLVKGCFNAAVAACSV